MLGECGNVAIPKRTIREEGSYRLKQNTKFQLECGYSVRTSFGTYCRIKLLRKTSGQNKKKKENEKKRKEKKRKEKKRKEKKRKEKKSKFN
jgi:hypothetical protein